MTGSDSFPARPSNMPQVGSFKIRRGQHWKRRLKSEVEFFSRSLLRLFQLLLKCMRTVSWSWSRAVTPYGKELYKKQVWCMCQLFNHCLCFINSRLFTSLGKMLSSFPSTLFVVFGCIFHLGVLPDTDRSCQGWQKRKYLRISSNSVSNTIVVSM